MRLFPWLLPLSLFLSACPAESDPPSVAGQPPQKAAEVSSEVACEYVARCGEVGVTCADCATPDGCGGCWAEVYEVDYDACIDELQPQLTEGFGCTDLTAEDEALIDACLAALPDRGCVDPATVEAWANGGSPQEDPRMPDACRRLESLRYACQD